MWRETPSRTKGSLRAAAPPAVLARAPSPTLCRRATLARTLGAIGLAMLLGCAAKPPPNEKLPLDNDVAAEAASLRGHLDATRAEAPATPEAGVRVRLAFSAGVDLDLYVTDPSFETVYFANSPNAAGGSLEQDERCGAPGPRVETIRFPATLSGAYRVGLDFPERCEGGPARAGFAIEIEGDGIGEHYEGMIDVGHFLPIVIEVTTPGG